MRRPLQDLEFIQIEEILPQCKKNKKCDLTNTPSIRLQNYEIIKKVVYLKSSSRKLMRLCVMLALMVMDMRTMN
jgi:hypothetical protein